MKKSMIISAVFLAVLALATTAMAADNESAGAGKAINLTDGANTLTLNYSPGVFGQYLTDAAETAGQKQWFAIGTYHGGGTNFYATSAQQTTIWKKTRGTNQTFTQAAIPTTASASASESQWTGGSWSK